MKSIGVALGGIDPTFDYIVGLMAPKNVLLTSEQYSDFEAMRNDYERTGYLKINVEHSDNTIFGSPIVNWQFRAWHDLCHIQANADFSPDGERRASVLQAKQLLDLYDKGIIPMDALFRWWWLIDSEVNGQGRYFQDHGDFPKNQREFTQEYIWTRFGVRTEVFPKNLDGFIIKW